MTDPLDQPQDDGLTLVMPFVVCMSNGGPYEDSAFTAGFQAGEIDHALKVAAVSQAATVAFPMVHADLAPQLDLIGMNRGFLVRVEATADGWCEATFERAVSDV